MRKKDLTFILASKVYYSLAVNVQKVGYRLDTKTKKGEIGLNLFFVPFFISITCKDAENKQKRYK